MTTLVLKLLKDGAWNAHGRHWNETPIGARWTHAVELLELWTTRARTRRELSGLDARMLRDIGITQAEARYEAAKPFWRP